MAPQPPKSNIKLCNKELFKIPVIKVDNILIKFMI